MKEQRRLMEMALKEIVIPRLRSKGFKGSYPHFRRFRNNLIDVISFQHYLAGGSFCVNVSSINSERLAHIRSLGWPEEKVNPDYTPDINRRLLQKLPDGRVTPNFRFGPMIGFSPPLTDPYSFFQGIAGTVAHLIEVQAEKWWADPHLFIPANYIDLPNIEF